MSDKISQEMKQVTKDLTSEFKTVQNERFLEYINLIYSKSKFYKNFLSQKGIRSREDLPKSIEEISSLPILDKKFLLEWSRSGESLGEIKNSVQTSGTVDDPVRIDYSEESIKIGWGKLGMRALFLMGINPEEKGMMLTSYDEEKKKSHSSHINTLALKKILGNNLIDQPIARRLNESLDKIVSEKVKWIGAIPNFYAASAKRSEERNINLKKLGIKTLFYGGLPFEGEKKEKTKSAYGSEILGLYPSSELCTAGCQVSLQNDLFEIKDEQYLLFNDYIIFEILDEKNNPVKKGERGKLVATPTFMDATPLVRFDLGDSVIFHGYKNNFMIISGIKRRNSIDFFNFQYEASEVERVKEDLLKNTPLSITGVQVAKVLGDKGVDLPIIRIETKERLSLEDEALIEREAIRSFRKNEYIDVFIRRGIHGGIHQPEIEFYGHKRLFPEIKLKPKLVSNESSIWDSYAFLQNKVQEHIGIMQELCEFAVQDLSGSKSVVDMACGSGYFSSKFAQAGLDVEGFDLSPSMIHYANLRAYDLNLERKTTFHKKPAEKTELPSHSKDAVFVANILCHITNPDDILAEAKRILKHGGKLIVGEPSKGLNEESVEKLKSANKKDLEKNPWMEKWYSPFVQHNQRMIQDIKSLFTLDEMKTKLENLGFTVLDTKPTYAGNAYYILAKINKRTSFKENVLEMSTFEAPLSGRNSQILLDFNEKTSNIPENILLKIEKFLREKGPNRYTNLNSLKERIANYAKVSEKEITITNGSYQGIDMIFRSTLKEKDKVLITKPCFDVFDHSGKMCGAQIIKTDYQENAAFPLEDILEKVDEETKLIIICNPSNPTGTPVLKSDIEEILKKFPEKTILVDEAYYEFCGITCSDLINKYPNLIISRTFSKAFGLASLRVGYLISNEENISHLSKLKSPFDVNSIAQIAADEALRDKSYMEDYVSEVMHKSKPFLEYFLNKKNIPYYPSSSNFIFIKISNAKEICKKLSEKGISISPKSGVNVGEGIRVTIGNYKDMKVFVEKLEEIIAE